MQHSTAARFAAWQSRHVPQTTRARERRLGLHAGPVFTAAPSQRTVLHSPDVGPLTALRAPWRAMSFAPARPVRSGLPGPVEVMAWTSSARGGGARRPSVAAAWRA